MNIIKIFFLEECDLNRSRVVSGGRGGGSPIPGLIGEIRGGVYPTLDFYKVIYHYFSLFIYVNR